MTDPERVEALAEALHGLACTRHTTVDACDYEADYRADAQALAPLLAEWRAADRAEALAAARRVEDDMSEAASMAWRSADARHGLSDHGALIIHADALTRWSERLRMAFGGDYYAEPDAGGDRG